MPGRRWRPGRAPLALWLRPRAPRDRSRSSRLSPWRRESRWTRRGRPREDRRRNIARRGPAWEKRRPSTAAAGSRGYGPRLPGLRRARRVRLPRLRRHLHLLGLRRRAYPCRDPGLRRAGAVSLPASAAPEVRGRGLRSVVLQSSWGLALRWMWEVYDGHIHGRAVTLTRPGPCETKRPGTKRLSIERAGADSAPQPNSEEQR